MDYSFSNLLESIKDKKSQAAEVFDPDSWAAHSKQQLVERKEHHSQDINNKTQNILLRKGFASKVFILTAVSLSLLFIAVVSSAIAHWQGKGSLSDDVIIHLIYFTGVNMLSAFSIVLTYLFSKK